MTPIEELIFKKEIEVCRRILKEFNKEKPLELKRTDDQLEDLLNDIFSQEKHEQI